MSQKRMECFELLFDRVAWIEHQFFSGIRDSRKALSLWVMMKGVGGVRKSIHQSWLAKGFGLGLLCWGFKGVQEEIPSEEASTLCYVLTFDPAQRNAIPRWCTGRKWHIPMAFRRGDRVGGLRLIIWDKVKVPLCQYRLMHRKRVTSKLHDSYFRLMTIKHSIQKIQWAIVWALNYYLTQLSSSLRSSCQLDSRQLETRCGRESHTRLRGPSETPMEFGIQRRWC